MKPFRTNKKDRETFARMLGYRLYECTDFKFGTDADIRDYEDNRVIGCEKGQWYFMHNGYQRVMARLHELGYAVMTGEDICSISVFDSCDGWEPVACGVSEGRKPNTGEALFRAVVAMGEAQK